MADADQKPGQAKSAPPAQKGPELVLVMTSNVPYPPATGGDVWERDILYSVEVKEPGKPPLPYAFADQHKVSGVETLDTKTSNDRPILLDPKHKEVGGYEDDIHVSGKGKYFNTTQTYFIDGVKATVYERDLVNGNPVFGTVVHVHATDAGIDVTVSP